MRLGLQQGANAVWGAMTMTSLHGRVQWQHLVAPPDGGAGRQAAERAESRGMKSAGEAGQCRLKTPRAEQELDSLMCVGLQEPGTLIQAGDQAAAS